MATKDENFCEDCGEHLQPFPPSLIHSLDGAYYCPRCESGIAEFAHGAGVSRNTFIATMVILGCGVAYVAVVCTAIWEAVTQ